MQNSKWLNSYENINLTDNEIHIWLLDIFANSSSEKELKEFLSDEEMERKNKFYFEKDRIVFGTTRVLLKILLARYINCPIDDLEFKYNEYGKPLLKNNNSSNIKFNVSHSNDFGMLAFNVNSDIGVDIEYINKELVTEDIARNYFSNYEVTQLFKLNEKDRISAFFNIWTRKEAFIKAIGKGLSIPLDSFDVSIEESKPQILRFGSNQIKSGLCLYNLPYIENYKSALVNIAERKKISNYFVSNYKYLLN